jgi:hypothetical protein
MGQRRTAADFEFLTSLRLCVEIPLFTRVPRKHPGATTQPCSVISVSSVISDFDFAFLCVSVPLW